MRFLSPKTCSSLSHQNRCLWFGLKGGAGLGAVGSHQLGGMWPGPDLPREDHIFPTCPQLVSAALGESKNRRESWEGQQAADMGVPTVNS